MKNIATKKKPQKSITTTFVQDQKVFDILKKYINADQKIMVAVSGGSDSILTACLVYNFFLKNNYNLKHLFFIHCNHNTRSGNTNDEKFINDFFARTQYIITKRTNKTKANEATLRTWRYKEFNTYIQKNKIDQVVFGHNMTDRIETTFLNLLRGANLNGFLAMQIQDTHHLLGGAQILRPILNISKDEIFTLCKKNKIPFITDPTNADNSTSMRNKLRNKILPELYKLAHKQSKTTNSYIESMKNIYEHLDTNIQQKEIILEPIKQSTHRNATFAYQRKIDPKIITNDLIIQILKQLGISNNITTPLLKERSNFIQTKESGYKYFNKTYLFKSHGNIYLISGPIFFWKKTIDKSILIDKLENTLREEQKYSIDKAEYLGATLRYPQTKDSYKNKTRNEWCINKKIPIFRRNFIPIIVKNNQIIKIFN